MAPRRGPGVHFWEFAIVAGEFGAAAGQTLMLTLLPLLLVRYGASGYWIGFAVGGEGLFALLLPFWAGLLSDRLLPALARRFGRRGFFILLTTPVMAGSLAVVPGLHGYWALVVCAFVYYAALHTFFIPLSALMIDSVPVERWGRVQGVRGSLHAAGLAYGLVGGGLLYALTPALPFLVGAAAVLLSGGLSWIAGWRVGRDHAAPVSSGGSDLRRDLKDLQRNHAALWFMLAVTFWNSAIDGMRPFFLLFGEAVVGISVAEVSLLGLVVVGALAIGSLVAGRLGDRYDRGKLLQGGALLMALAFGAGIFVRHVPDAVSMLILAGAGAAVFTALEYPYFARLTSGSRIGQYTGLFTVGVGLGRFVAPQLVGLAIDYGRAIYPQYRGYPLMWPVPAVLCLLGLWALRRSHDSEVESLARGEP